MKISRSREIQLVYTVYPKHNRRSFQWSVFIASWLIGPSIVTERASDDKRLGGLDNAIFVAKLSGVRI